MPFIEDSRVARDPLVTLRPLLLEQSQLRNRKDFAGERRRDRFASSFARLQKLKPKLKVVHELTNPPRVSFERGGDELDQARAVSGLE